MKALIEVVEHDKQRYETVGDWQYTEKDNFYVTVSRMDNWKYELLVGIHELIEAALCKDRGITDNLVSDFDRNFEALRQPGNTDEPGDHQFAPYKNEHFFATSIERLIAAELNVDWKEYDDAVQAL